MTMTDQGRKYRPKAPLKVHWQGLQVFQHGKELKGDAKVKALHAWKRAEDPTVWCRPRTYGPQNINWEGLPVLPPKDTSEDRDKDPV